MRLGKKTRTDWNVSLDDDDDVVVGFCQNIPKSSATWIWTQNVWPKTYLSHKIHKSAQRIVCFLLLFSLLFSYVSYEFLLTQKLRFFLLFFWYVCDCLKPFCPCLFESLWVSDGNQMFCLFSRHFSQFSHYSVFRCLFVSLCLFFFPFQIITNFNPLI